MEIPDILNTEREELDASQDEILTKLGVLIKPLPKAPKSLTKEQAENLNSITYTYFMSEENGRPAILESLSKRLNVSEEELTKFFKEYEESTNALADSVVKIATKEYVFDNDEIARYTRDNFSQTVINEKTVKVYDSAIEKHKKKVMDRDEK